MNKQIGYKDGAGKGGGGGGRYDPGICMITGKAS